MTIAVLLVDDHAVVRDGLSFLLEAAGDIRVPRPRMDAKKVEQTILHHLQVVVMDVSMALLIGVEPTQQSGMPALPPGW